MIKYTIPIILTLTVLVAGVFAFVPVEEASTVHTTIIAAQTQLVEESVVATTAQDDFTITCNSANSACIIREIYLDDDSGSTVDVQDITLTVTTGSGDDESLVVAADNLNAATGGGATDTVALSGIGNIAIGSGDVLKLEMLIGNSDITYGIIVIAEVEGSQGITVARVDN